MHDLGGVLSWEAPESMLRVMSDLVRAVMAVCPTITMFFFVVHSIYDLSPYLLRFEYV